MSTPTPGPDPLLRRPVPGWAAGSVWTTTETRSPALISDAMPGDVRDRLDGHPADGRPRGPQRVTHISTYELPEALTIPALAIGVAGVVLAITIARLALAPFLPPHQVTVGALVIFAIAVLIAWVAQRAQLRRWGESERAYGALSTQWAGQYVPLDAEDGTRGYLRRVRAALSTIDTMAGDGSLLALGADPDAEVARARQGAATVINALARLRGFTGEHREALERLDAQAREVAELRGSEALGEFPGADGDEGSRLWRERAELESAVDESADELAGVVLEHRRKARVLQEHHPLTPQQFLAGEERP